MGAPLTTALLLCGGRGTRLGGETEKPLVEVGGRPMVAEVLDALAASRVRRVVAVTSPHAPATTRFLRARAGGSESDDGVAGVSLAVHEGSGEGYVADLDAGLSTVGGPALTVVADLPLLRARDVDAALDAALGMGDGDSATTRAPNGSNRSVTVCVPASLKRDLGASVDTSFTHEGRELAPTGLNVVCGRSDGGDRGTDASASTGDGDASAAGADEGDARAAGADEAAEEPVDDVVLVRERTSLAVNVNRPADLALARRLAGRR